MTRAREKAAYFIAKECTQVDMLQDEFNTFDIPVEMGALRGEYARAAARLVPGKRKKSAEKPYRNEDEDEIGHG